MDEFELDVTDLREPVDESTHDVTAPRPNAAQARPRASRRLRAAFSAAVVLLVAATLLLSIPQAPATLAALLRLPTPTTPAPLPIGADTLVLQHTVPWGVLRVDGAPPRHLGTALVPPNTQGAQLPALTLARGRHSLSYQAPPFPTLRCVISVPAAHTDSCPLLPQAVTGPLETFGLARIVDLGATPALLPRRQREALVSAVAAALTAESPTAALAPGDLYLSAAGTPTVAREPLAATLRYALDTVPSAIGPDGEGVCGPLCTDAHDQVSFSEWLLTGQMDLTWQYAPAAGVPFTGSVVAEGPRSAIAVPLLVTWHGAWQVALAPLLVEPECALAADAASAALQRVGLASDLACTTAAHPADGCLVIAQPVDSAHQPVGLELALYYRFGVLFTGNTAARKRLPALPAIGKAALALLPRP